MKLVSIEHAKMYSITQSVVFFVYMLLYFIPEGLLFSSFDILFLKLLLVVLLVYLNYHEEHHFMSPLLFWYTFWLAPLAFARFDLHLYLNISWTQDTINNIGFNTVIFFVVFVLVKNITFPKIVLSRHESCDSFNRVKLKEITLFLLTLGLVGFFSNCVFCGNIPQLTSNPNLYRITFVETAFFSIFNVCRFALCFPSLYKNELDKGWFCKTNILVFLYFLCTFLTGWRGFFFQSMILYITPLFYYYYIKIKKGDLIEKRKLAKKQYRTILKVALIGFIVIGVIALTRANQGFDVFLAIL